MFKVDKILLTALILGFVFTIHGIHWGKVESWNLGNIHPGSIPGK